MTAVLEVLLLPLGVVVVGLLIVGLRRRLLQRGGGAVDLSMRLHSDRYGRGWCLGVGRFAGEELQFYRVFSLSPRPRRVLSRADLQVRAQREPKGPEVLALQKGAVVLECTTRSGEVQIGVDKAAVTGVLAWLEARPPEAHSA